MAGFDHVEVWVADFEVEKHSWNWLLGRLGFVLESSWDGGCSWGLGGAYLTITTPPTLMAEAAHERRRPGVNHLAFKAGGASEVDVLMAGAYLYGWKPLYADRCPYAGGPGHYAR